MNEDQRREFLRTWAGRVVASHANELWEADFTRCDAFVVDPNHPEKPFRLRIHATIDVFSGAVPSFVFSRLESQQPTHRMLVLAMHPKPGEWGARWPIFGRPRRIYWDNGKVYTAEATTRAMRTLEVEYTHSRAWVSHSRGRIERFFETFHKGFEAGLKSYAGEDASQRNNWELARLAANTRKWLEGGADPDRDPWPDRMPTEGEYMRQALTWLVADYHKEILAGGKTREELFLESAPPSTLVRFDLLDLFKIFARQEPRTVTGNGTVRYNNTFWALPEGRLMAYQGQEVVVLEAEHPLTGVPLIYLTLPQPDGTLLELGQAHEVGGAALSAESRAHRRESTLAARALLEEGEALKSQYLNPAWRQDSILARAARMPLEPLRLSLQGPKATLEAAPTPTHPDPLEALEDEDPFVRALASLFVPQQPPGDAEG
jgi:putative transposase